MPRASHVHPVPPPISRRAAEELELLPPVPVRGMPGRWLAGDGSRASSAQALVLPPAVIWIAAWLLMVVVAFATRPIFPIDESRYLSVAWEMWQRRDFLVPHHNGLPYSDKPPLLFWLTNAGWWLFGVSEWWPRLVPSLFALGGLGLTASFARRLWGVDGAEALTAPVILVGTLTWAFYSTVFTFDMLVVFFTLLALRGVWYAGGEQRRLRGWTLFALGVGLGLLAKGPVLLLFVLPPALLVRWWGKAGGLWRWAAGLGAALAAGVGIALAWALPAAAAGGPDYAGAILLRQTTQRLVQATAHPEPWWWYLALLPVLLFPFSLWPTLWRRLGRLRSAPPEVGVRFLLSWVVPAFVLFSLISSKRPHYLLPLLPGLALLAARALRGRTGVGRLGRLAVPLTVTAVLGLALMAIPLVSPWKKLPHWVSTMEPGAGLLLVAAAILGLVLRHRRGPLLHLAAALGVLVFVTLHLGVVAVAVPAYDVYPISAYLSFLEQEGVPVAHLGTYHDQFQFEGRLERPLEVIEPGTAVAWLREHPGGRVVGYYDTVPPPELGAPEFAQPFRSRVAAVWSRRPGVGEVGEDQASPLGR